MKQMRILTPEIEPDRMAYNTKNLYISIFLELGEC